MKVFYLLHKYLRLAVVLNILFASSSQSTKTIIKVTTILSPGFLELNKDGLFVGFIPDVLAEIEKFSNYSFPLQSSADDKSIIAKTYRELIPNILSNKCDMIAADFKISSFRYKQIDYSVELLDIGTVLLVRTPSNMTAIPKRGIFFLRPFSLGAWLSGIAVLFLSAALIVLNSQFNPREKNFYLSQNNAENKRFSLSSALFYVFSSCLCQGNHLKPRSISGKVIFVNFWIFELIFLLTYGSALLATILSSTGVIPEPLLVTNLNEAAGQAKLDKIRPIFLANSSTENLMKKSTRPEIRDLYEAYQRKRDLNRNFKTMDGIIDTVRLTSDVVAIVESTLAHRLIKSSKCEITTLPNEEFLFESSIAFAFRHGDDKHINNLRRTVNEIITELRSNGRIQQIYDNHFRSKVSCLGTSTQIGRITSKAAMEITKTFSESLPITMNLFVGPIIVYLIGIIVAGFGALFDAIIFTRCERNNIGNQSLREFEASDSQIGLYSG